MKILALDVGKFNSVACFFQSKTRKPKFLTTPPKPERQLGPATYFRCV